MNIADKDNIVKIINALKEQRIIISNKEIVDKTGFNKGYISNIINKKQAAGEGFIKKFNEVFLSTNVSFLKTNKVANYDLYTFENEENKLLLGEEEGQTYGGHYNYSLKQIQTMETELHYLRKREKDLEKLVDMLERENTRLK